MKNAIRLAIKGGYMNSYSKKWEYNNVHNIKFYDGDDLYRYTWERITMAPDFWQCLGKAMGWDGKENCSECGDIWEQSCWCDRANTHAVTRYKHYWHQFIDAISEGKTSDDFFNDLLNGTK